jgi:hypothetical protein
MKKLGIVLVLFGMMMGIAWGSVAADAEDLDIAVIRALGGQYQATARGGESQVDVVVIRGRQGWTYEPAAYSEPQLDIAVVRAGGGQYTEFARDGEPRLDIVVIRGRQSLPGTVASMLVQTGGP